MNKLKFLPALFLAIVLSTGTSYSQTLNKGSIVSIHEWNLTLHPGVTMEQFLDYWTNTLLPEVDKLFPEMKSLVLKGIAGESKGKFAGLYYYDSLETMRSYWNEDGSPTEESAPKMEAFGPLFEGIGKFGEFKWEVSDWEIIHQQ